MKNIPELFDYEDVPRPDGSDRYRIYALKPDGELLRLADCGETALAFTLDVLIAEGQIDESWRVGVRDRVTGPWLVNPFTKSGFAHV